MTTPDCRKILVVEDDLDIRESLKYFLESENYEPYLAGNGQEALDLLSAGLKPCLILLDMMMPIMGGREFLDTAMKNAVLAPLPVFIISAAATKENTVGSVGFIKKPADLNIILQVVKTYCP